MIFILFLDTQLITWDVVTQQIPFSCWKLHFGLIKLLIPENVGKPKKMKQILPKWPEKTGALMVFISL